MTTTPTFSKATAHHFVYITLRTPNDARGEAIENIIRQAFTLALARKS